MVKPSQGVPKLGRMQGKERVTGERAPRRRVDCSAGSGHEG
jgi:hypothetical protein